MFNFRHKSIHGAVLYLFLAQAVQTSHIPCHSDIFYLFTYFFFLHLNRIQIFFFFYIILYSNHSDTLRQNIAFLSVMFFHTAIRWNPPDVHKKTSWVTTIFAGQQCPQSLFWSKKVINKCVCPVYESENMIDWEYRFKQQVFFFFLNSDSGIMLCYFSLKHSQDIYKIII